MKVANQTTPRMAGSALTTKFALASLLAAGALGQVIPEFVHGEECLFCHRRDIGPAWQSNPHNVTTRPASEGSDEFLLGRGSLVLPRKLRKQGYGAFAILENSEWNAGKFAAQCAGCHTTAVDPRDGTFAYYGIDCYACHGVVDLNHSGDTKLVWLSKKNRADVARVNATCGQCHVRGGKSRASGKPYPEAFVAGRDLLADFQVDLGLADSAELNPGDRHVYRSVRDGVSCLDCHAVHARSSNKHRRALSGAICQDCHFEGRPRKEVRTYRAISATCEVLK